QPDLNHQRAVRCTFSIGGNADCNGGGSYAATDSNLNTILSAQNDYLTLNPSNDSYNAGTGVYQFNVTVQNLIPEALGTLNGATLDAAGVRLFLQNSKVTSGTGSISIINADGTGTFTDANQPYFQYNQILQQDEVSDVKTVRVNVPNTVGSFTLDFFVSTKAQVKVLLNEVLVNPNDGITDANGEWFELYNAGRLPVNLKNFKINDYGNSNPSGCNVFPCEQPSHTIASDLIMQSGAYAVLGKTTNTTDNGGVPVDYAYGAALSLANSQDRVRVQAPDALGSLTIDMTQYAQAGISAKNGVSRELKNPALDNSNMDGSNWSGASVTSVYGAGGRGTPKYQNSGYTPAADPMEEKSSVEKSSVEKTSADTNFAPVLDNGSATVTANPGTITPGGFAIVTYRVIIANPIPVGATQISSLGSISGTNFAGSVTDDPSTPAANDATVTPIGFAPTAAWVSISGTVMMPQNLGLTNALVTLTDMQGNSRTFRTGRLGSFRFTNVTAGETYILTVSSKRYTYAPQVITVNEDLTEVNFMPQ
ncbi:MAG TPA: lamin tail domain-containing protein, partial [Pyrinomonadaceae bacterium]|nr:lamin tail domain-containing protein [Pyrinomonadaceae bacterium]